MTEEEEDKIAFFARKEIRRNLKAYVDDMVIKSTSKEDMLHDIQETFDRRLRRYFQGHPIRVLTDAPIKKTLTNPEKSGHRPKWAIELGEHDIEFGERGSQKTQIPKDSSIEMPPEEGEKVVTRRVDTGKEGPRLESIWKLYTDGASSSNGSRVGLMLISPKGRE
ncbi:hypothetical protein Tco_0630972 [Tanacetum coccineum]